MKRKFGFNVDKRMVVSQVSDFSSKPCGDEDVEQSLYVWIHIYFTLAHIIHRFIRFTTLYNVLYFIHPCQP